MLTRISLCSGFLIPRWGLASFTTNSVVNLSQGDVVEYSTKQQEQLEVGVYEDGGKIIPLVVRESSGEPDLLFMEESAAFDFNGAVIHRIVKDVFMTQRRISDRIENPHGEEAEDCFVLEGEDSLSPGVQLRVIP